MVASGLEVIGRGWAAAHQIADSLVHVGQLLEGLVQPVGGIGHGLCLLWVGVGRATDEGSASHRRSHISPRSFRLRKSSLPMMTWSSMSMPIISPACTKRRVRLMSSWLGDTSPDG